MRNALYKRTIQWAGFLLASVSLAASPVTLDVSPTGALPSLKSARDTIRAERQKGTLPKDAPVIVTLAPGEYAMRETLDLGKEDGFVTYRAAQRGTVRFSGATKWTAEAFQPLNAAEAQRFPAEVRGRIRVADVAAALPGEVRRWGNESRVPPGPWLYINGAMQPIARWPNETPFGGWTNFTQVIDRGLAEPQSPDPAKRAKHAGSFVFNAPRVANWDFAEGVWLYGYWTHDWFEQILKAKAWIATPTNHVMELAGVHPYGIAGQRTWGAANRRFFALNVPAELDAPGEWWLDRTAKRLYVMPPQDWATAAIRLAVFAQPFIKAEGAKHVRFENLAFEYAHETVFAVAIKNCEDVVLAGCDFRNLGGGGISIEGGRRCQIRQSDIRNLGATAIRIDGGDRKTLTRGDHVVADCTIRNFARFWRTYNPGVNLGGVGQTVRNCFISEAPHNAILYGGNDHRIEGNEICHVVQETADSGAIYAGRDPTSLGNVIRGNYIHDLGKEPQFAGTSSGGYIHGVYVDDCDWGESIVSNVFARCGGCAIFLCGGNLHETWGNVIVECANGTGVDSRGRTWPAFSPMFRKPANYASWWHEAFAKRNFDWRNPPWSTHYPRVAEILADEPDLPKVCPITNNWFVACAKNHHFDKETPAITNILPICGNHYYRTVEAAIAAGNPWLTACVQRTLKDKPNLRPAAPTKRSTTPDESSAERARAGVVLSTQTTKHKVTAGWENVNVRRTEWPAVKIIWSAPKEGFTVAREDGAEGDVMIAEGVIRIIKRNDQGRIVVTAPAFTAEKGKTLRFFADVSSSVGISTSAEGWLAVYGEKRSVWFTDKESEKWIVGGGPTMTGLANSAPGMSDRKYTHFTPAETPITPVIVVTGTASTSTWRNWTAEDLEAAQEKWDAHVANVRMPDRSGDMQDLADFERALAADIDHTAEVRRVKDRSALFIDGAEVPPIVYKACEWNVKGRVTYAGKPLQRAGVTLGVINLRLGKLPTLDGPWSEKGFDVQAAVATIRRDMRVGDASCFVLAIGTSAYPKFSEEHPDETWRNEDGSVVRGNSGSAIPDVYNDGGKPDPGDVRWPWMSYCSPAWRAAIKRNVEILVAELRRQGLLKRIVGVHFFGYHDGQFAVPIPDCSAPAKAAHTAYLAQHGLKAGDPGSEYEYFMKQIGFQALEEFSRAAKQAFGKPIVAFRWCMSPFSDCSGSYDVGSFLHSDAVDIIVPQPSYAWRRPGYTQGVRLPCQSFHRHRKLMLYEFDLRTWAALDDWAHSVVETKGLSQADDLEMWQTLFRKHAGIMTAQRMGWWFYDMGGGWFYPDPIVDDIRAVTDVRRDLMRAKVEDWHPDAALVVDELSMALYNHPGHPQVKNQSSLVMSQWQRTAASGVPYDFYHIDDLLADPSLAKQYKALALCGFLYPDASRQALMQKIASFGVKTFVVQPGGYSPAFFHDFVKGAGGYVATQPGVMQVDMNGDFLSVHGLVPGAYDLKLPFAAEVINLKSGERESVQNQRLRLSLSAGETCWFRLKRIASGE